MQTAVNRLIYSFCVILLLCIYSLGLLTCRPVLYTVCVCVYVCVCVCVCVYVYVTVCAQYRLLLQWCNVAYPLSQLLLIFWYAEIPTQVQEI